MYLAIYSMGTFFDKTVYISLVNFIAAFLPLDSSFYFSLSPHKHSWKNFYFLVNIFSLIFLLFLFSTPQLKSLIFRKLIILLIHLLRTICVLKFACKLNIHDVPAEIKKLYPSHESRCCFMISLSLSLSL